ncbi:unnamed protein product [Lactuca virosa]|uniref:Uncharacterized protein n=1 Tax=Lactuca virosa TaxID=75947 RepID=A0AAU9LY56_9ASTR|nr:unnamed protein product [Lactuca virosa]
MDFTQFLGNSPISEKKNSSFHGTHCDFEARVLIIVSSSVFRISKMADPTYTVFENIYTLHPCGKTLGTLRVDGRLMVLEDLDSAIHLRVRMLEIKDITWRMVNDGKQQLGLLLHDGSKHRIYGFSNSAAARMSRLLQDVTGIEPRQEEIAVSGKTRGQLEVHDKRVLFKVDEKLAFDFGVDDVVDVKQTKHPREVELKFPDNPREAEDSLVGMVFQTSSSSSGEALTQKLIKSGAGFMGEQAIAVFEELKILHPRVSSGHTVGIGLHVTCVKLQKKEVKEDGYEDTIQQPYPRPHDTSIGLIIDPWVGVNKKDLPEKIIIQFDSRFLVQKPMMISEQVRRMLDKYEKQHILEKAVYTGPISKVFGEMLQRMCDKKVIVSRHPEVLLFKNSHVVEACLMPSERKASSRKKDRAREASVKATDGLLYVFDDSVFFLPSPPTSQVKFIRYKEIGNVQVERNSCGSSTHCVGLIVELKKKEEKHHFSHIWCNCQTGENEVKVKVKVQAVAP